MKTLLSTIGIFLFSLGILSAQSDPISKNDTIISGEISPKIQADSLQLIIPEKFKNFQTSQKENQEFVYETDPIFGMPIAKPGYRMPMPVIKPDNTDRYNMPIQRFYPK